MELSKEVYCTLQVEGTHNWPGCPFDEVAYLRDVHRHVFHVKAYKKVTHNDRDTEFIMLKHQIIKYMDVKYGVNYDGEHRHLCVFGAMSCEMIAADLIKHFGLSRCDVSEDNENGAIVTVIERDYLR
jgi:hypothetical protein